MLLLRPSVLILPRPKKPSSMDSWRSERGLVSFLGRVQGSRCERTSTVVPHMHHIYLLTRAIQHLSPLFQRSSTTRQHLRKNTKRSRSHTMMPLLPFPCIVRGSDKSCWSPQRPKTGRGCKRVMILRKSNCFSSMGPKEAQRVPSSIEAGSRRISATSPIATGPLANHCAYRAAGCCPRRMSSMPRPLRLSALGLWQKQVTETSKVIVA